jgi:hypothetical protein
VAGRKPPRLRRHFYGEGKPGRGYIPAIPPKPAEDAVWDDYWWKWVRPGLLVDETVEPPEYGEVPHGAR